MDIKRVLTTVIGLPAVIAIIVFGNTVIIDIFFRGSCINKLKRIL